MSTVAHRSLDACLWLTETIGRADTLDEIYTAALESLRLGLGVDRSSILLFDPDGVMRFKAWRGLSDDYRRAVEGHTPWAMGAPVPDPIVVHDVFTPEDLTSFQEIFSREDIRAITFIPLASGGRVIGKFMLYYRRPTSPGQDALKLAGILAGQVAFAVDRTRAQDAAVRSEERLRFALEAADMGTWEWIIGDDRVRWSESLERVHGLSAGGFDGTFESFARDIDPRDRARVTAAARRAVDEHLPYDIEYRIVTPAGEPRWVAGTGRVESDPSGVALRMTGVCMNITRRKQAEIDRLRGAREAGRMKDEFLAVLSHELRTPLNAILGWAQLLQSGALDPARGGEAIGIIERNARLQAQLIEQILDVSRIIAGKVQLDRAMCHPAQLVEHAITTIEPAATAKGLALQAEIAPDLPALDADVSRLQQVLGNVLSNAVKFTPKGGRISLRCFAAEGSLVLEVRDTGAGIAPAFLPDVFERFRQADASPTRQHGGLGLGLAIARHLIEMHGGTIEAQSDGPGSGTTMRITLPATLPASAEPAADAAHLKAALSGAHVLVVDDEADARELLVAILTKQGAIVREAASAGEAVDQVAHTRVDLLIADIGMPDVDGYDLIRVLRRAEDRVRAIALTAYARPEDRTRALQAGYDGFLAKPFEPAVLIRLSAALRTDRSASRPTTASFPSV